MKVLGGAKDPQGILWGRSVGQQPLHQCVPRGQSGGQSTPKVLWGRSGGQKPSQVATKKILQSVQPWFRILSSQRAGVEVQIGEISITSRRLSQQGIG